MRNGPFPHISPTWLLSGVFLLFPGIGVAQDSGLAVELMAVGSGYSNVLETPATVSPEARLKVGVGSAGALEISAGLAEASTRFDTPTGTSSLPIQVWWLGLDYRHTLISLGSTASLSGALGFGLTSIGHEAFVVPLGALGSTEIPATVEQHFHLAADLGLSKQLFSRIHGVLGTRVQWLSPASSAGTIYSLYGGFSIEIL